MTENNERQWLAAGEAAQAMGTTELNILMHIKRGFLQGREVDGEWQVSAESLTAFQRESQGAKAKVVCQSGCGGKKGGCGTCG